MTRHYYPSDIMESLILKNLSQKLNCSRTLSKSEFYNLRYLPSFIFYETFNELKKAEKIPFYSYISNINLDEEFYLLNYQIINWTIILKHKSISEDTIIRLIDLNANILNALYSNKQYITPNVKNKLLETLDKYHTKSYFYKLLQLNLLNDETILKYIKKYKVLNFSYTDVYCPELLFPIEFIMKHPTYFDWNMISERHDLPEEFIENNLKKLNLCKVLRNNNVSHNFLLKDDRYVNYYTRLQNNCSLSDDNITQYALENNYFTLLTNKNNLKLNDETICRILENFDYEHHHIDLKSLLEKSTNTNNILNDNIQNILLAKLQDYPMNDYPFPYAYIISRTNNEKLLALLCNDIQQYGCTPFFMSSQLNKNYFAVNFAIKNNLLNAKQLTILDSLPLEFIKLNKDKIIWENITFPNRNDYKELLRHFKKYICWKNYYA